jgi:hypothetical protein
MPKIARTWIAAGIKKILNCPQLIFLQTKFASVTSKINAKIIKRSRANERKRNKNNRTGTVRRTYRNRITEAVQL